MLVFDAGGSMTSSPRPPWWRGARGEWYVVVQVVLMAAVFFAPRTHPALPAWPAPFARAGTIAGFALMFAGGSLFLAGILRLGRNLTPLPVPRRDATLVETGPYRLVRHPIYAGGILLTYGWALAVHGWLTLVYATVLLIFFDFKSTREERWLTARFPAYPDYQRRVSKLVPFLR
jgi:protein-S-isoprenylcysteine O-methyltransferase Ste14